jgi:YaiO family outer membrane protein
MIIHLTAFRSRPQSTFLLLVALLTACWLSGTVEAENNKASRSDMTDASNSNRTKDIEHDAQLSEEIYNFVRQLTHAYENGEIDEYIAFYSKSATENGMTYDQIKKYYSSLFKKGASSYSISNMTIHNDSTGIKLTGILTVSDPHEYHNSRIHKGVISMTLIRENGNLRIISSRRSEEKKAAGTLVREMEAARASGAVETVPLTDTEAITEKPTGTEKTRLEQIMQAAERSGAVEIEPPGQTVSEPKFQLNERKNRLELSAEYEYLHPHGDYGDWGNVTATLYRKERPDLTWFVQLGADFRKEGEGMLASAGAYKDWTDSLFTYTALTTGTNSSYLPQFRADQDFNLRIGPKKNFVWVVGGTYIQYFDVHREYILSTGLSAYLGMWVAEYRVFRNISDPGSEVSYSQLFSLAYGLDGWQWTTGTFSFGKQAYLSTAIETPESVNNNSVLATLDHRHWLGKDYGVFGEIGYFKLSHSYQKYGMTIGVFKEF